MHISLSSYLYTNQYGSHLYKSAFLAFKPEIDCLAAYAGFCWPPNLDDTHI